MSDINWDNKKEVINAIKENVFFVLDNKSKINKNLLNDYELGMEFIMKYPYSLKLLSDELRNNYDIVKTAVANNGLALEYAGDDLKNNFDIVEIAVTQYGYSINYANSKILNNKEFISKLYNNVNKVVLQYASEELQKQIIIENIENDIEILKYVSNKIFEDKEFMLELLKINFDAIEYIACYYKGCYCNEYENNMICDCCKWF